MVFCVDNVHVGRSYKLINWLQCRSKGLKIDFGCHFGFCTWVSLECTSVMRTCKKD